MARSRSQLFPIYLTVFIDLLGSGIVVPVLAPLFLLPSSPLAHVDWDLATRTILIGLVAAAYPIAQFFGAPYIGALSDRWGRKPVLLASLAGTVIGYVFFALAIRWRLLWLLFASRALDGFTGGNISTAQSAIADISTETEKAVHFGTMGIAYGLGFILGPYIGAKMTDLFNPAAPFWFAAALTFVNVILVALLFRETLHHRIFSPMSLLTGIQNVGKAFRLLNLRTIFAVTFLFTLGFNFFTQFFQVLAIEKYHFTVVMIGSIFAYIGIWVAITQGVITRFVAHRWKPERVLPWSLLIWAVTTALVMIPQDVQVLYLITPFMALAVGLSIPNGTTLVSNLADPASQGEVMGINQSISALAMALPPLIAGFAASINVYLPIALAAMFVFLAWLVFMIGFREKRVVLFHEM